MRSSLIGTLCAALSWNCALTSAFAYPTKYKATILTTTQYIATAANGVSGPAQFGYGTKTINPVISHALLWHSSAASEMDLNPFGYGDSIGTGISGNSQVGYGTHIATFSVRALLWHGTAESAIDLNPLGYTFSEALGIAGESQVGVGAFENGPGHAILWHGSAASAVDLNPSGYKQSMALGASANSQVGWAGSNFPTQAFLWRGSADSAVNLHNSAYGTDSLALGASEDSQVGYAYSIGSNSKAILWHGTASSAVSLEPTGYTNTFAWGVAGDTQVGFGNALFDNFGSHALVWHESAASVVDLHAFLGSGFTDSEALAVDSDGNVVGFASSISGNYPVDFAVLWTPVPEPAGGLFLASGLLSFSCLKRTCAPRHVK